MRGYYQGRYTDNDMITVQVELRQRIWSGRMRGMGRRGQRFPLAVAIRLVADAAQLRRRTPVGTEKTGERAPRLRIRQENQRFPAEHQRGFLREFV